MRSVIGHRPTPRLVTLAVGVALAVTMAVVGAPSAAAAGCAPFPDVDSSNVHCADIAWLADQGIADPVDGHFHPGQAISRDTMAAFLYRLTHLGNTAPGCTNEPVFSDVDPHESFCGAITWLVEIGVTHGYTDGTFRSDESVTRGTMAAFFYRLATSNQRAPECTSRPFGDVPVPSTFCGAIAWMKHTGTSLGYVDGHYGPAEPVSRQAMASFLRRAAEGTDVASASGTLPGKTGGGLHGSVDPDPAATAPTGVVTAPTGVVTARVLAQVNRIRAEASPAAAPLRLDAQTGLVALCRSQEQAAEHLMSHHGFNEAPCFTDAFRWHQVAENVAYGQTDPVAATTAWEHSPGHYANIVNPSFELLGVAVAHDADGRPYYTMILRDEVSR